MDQAFNLIVTIALPSFAILVPTVVAIWLARNERQASEFARKEERELAEKHYLASRVDTALETVVGALVTYQMGGDNIEDLAQLQTSVHGAAWRLFSLPDRNAHELADWIQQEIDQGFKLRNETIHQSSSPGFLSLHSKPFQGWVDHTMSLITLYTSGQNNLEEIRRKSNEYWNGVREAINP